MRSEADGQRCGVERHDATGPPVDRDDRHRNRRRTSCDDHDGHDGHDDDGDRQRDRNSLNECGSTFEWLHNG